MRYIYIYLTSFSLDDAEGEYIANNIGNMLARSKKTIEWSVEGEKRMYRAFQCMKDEQKRIVVIFREVQDE